MLWANLRRGTARVAQRREPALDVKNGPTTCAKARVQERPMAEFAVIRHYHFDPKNSAEIDRKVREGFVPLISKAKGFIRYYWLDSGKGEAASFGVFRDKAGADESVRLAADFVRENLAKLMTSKPDIIEGPVVAHD